MTASVRVLALVGMPGAGKTLCARHLEDRGYFQFRFGSIVVDEVVRRGLPINPDNERLVREEFRRREGMDAIALRALPILQDALSLRPSLVIDGLYSFSEYKTLRYELGAAMVVTAVVSPRALRYERLASRPDRPLSAEEAERRDVLEIENLEKGGPIAIADYFLLNDHHPEAVLTALDGLIIALGMRP